MQKKYKASVALAVKVQASIQCKACQKSFAPRNKEQQFCSRDCVWAYMRAHGKDAPLVKLFKPENHPQKLTDPFDEVDDQLWAERAKYWEGKDSGQTPWVKVLGRGTRQRLPLVLTGHGIRLRVERGALFVQNGFSYYPQKRQEWRLFPGEWRLPTRIVLVGASGSISLPVISWLNQQEIPLVILNWQGEIVSVIGNSQTAADPELAKAQREALENEKGLEFSIELIREKIAASQETLKSLPDEYEVGRTVHKLELIKKSLQYRASDFTGLRMTEAVAAQIYFGVWRKLRLKWKADKKNLIPDEWHYFSQRGTPAGEQNTPAIHPVNARLNYAYRVLESQVLVATIAAGFDPTIGYLHTCRPGRMALVYDLMEPLRPKVDRAILGFVQSRTFTWQDFILTEKGTCRLSPALIQIILAQTVEKQDVEKLVEELRNCFLQSI